MQENPPRLFSLFSSLSDRASHAAPIASANRSVRLDSGSRHHGATASSLGRGTSGYGGNIGNDYTSSPACRFPGRLNIENFIVSSQTPVLCVLSRECVARQDIKKQERKKREREREREREEIPGPVYHGERTL
ncbi:hypothetical protein LX32DRAFT_380534 [Colletotrichum zoysiae]|uniref:Uncharacterized protein n=1 Tax=Colletotrichum zoysiae TaxID=1216348 RepID=A0AAD9HIV4_9PEZI|nr:hypothetical protein LX32DRAFT_380534 [Colletotrichum zoysiae]